MGGNCSICGKENKDISEEIFKEVDDKTYCNECFNTLKDNIVYCNKCYDYEHKDETFNEKYTETIKNNELIYYHVNCLSEEELCGLCKKYLFNEEYVYFFKDNFHTIQCHKRCIEDKDNILKYNICKECGISFKAKCIGCDHIFNDCCNPDCNSYDKYYIEDENRYAGYCSKCNW